MPRCLLFIAVPERDQPEEELRRVGQRGLLLRRDKERAGQLVLAQLVEADALEEGGSRRGNLLQQPDGPLAVPGVHQLAGAGKAVVFGVAFRLQAGLGAGIGRIEPQRLAEGGQRGVVAELRFSYFHVHLRAGRIGLRCGRRRNTGVRRREEHGEEHHFIRAARASASALYAAESAGLFAARATAAFSRYQSTALFVGGAAKSAAIFSRVWRTCSAMRGPLFSPTSASSLSAQR